MNCGSIDCYICCEVVSHFLVMTCIRLISLPDFELCAPARTLVPKKPLSEILEHVGNFSSASFFRPRISYYNYIPE